MPEPMLPTVLASAALLLGGSEEQRREILPAVAKGETIVFARLPGSRKPLRSVSVTTRAERTGGKWRLTARSDSCERRERDCGPRGCRRSLRRRGSHRSASCRPRTRSAGALGPRRRSARGNMMRSALAPFGTSRFSPVSRHLPPVRSARVVTRYGSKRLPASGSRAKRSSRPWRRQEDLRRCSSLPPSSSAAEASTVGSIARASGRGRALPSRPSDASKPSPLPPYFSGSTIPVQPSPAISCQRSRENASRSPLSRSARTRFSERARADELGRSCFSS